MTDSKQSASPNNRDVTTADVLEGREWQVVKILEARQDELIYNRIRYGLTEEEAADVAARDPLLAVAPMPTPADGSGHSDE